jgi:hypothetical protein
MEPSHKFGYLLQLQVGHDYETFGLLALPVKVSGGWFVLGVRHESLRRFGQNPKIRKQYHGTPVRPDWEPPLAMQFIYGKRRLQEGGEGTAFKHIPNWSGA